MKSKITLTIIILINLITIPTATATTTKLTIEPPTITYPYIELEDGASLFEVAVKIHDVTNLKEYHLDFAYDSNIIEFVSGTWDQSFYVTTRGGTGGWLDMRLADYYTGTGEMYHYTFRVLKPGNTTISLKNVELIDTEGAQISFETEPCDVSILSLEDYSDKINKSLLNELENLHQDYTDLESELSTLQTEYNELSQELSTLSSENTLLDELNEELQDSVEDLQTQITTLTDEITNISNEVSDLQEELQNQGIPGFPITAIIIGLLALFYLKPLKNR